MQPLNQAYNYQVRQQANQTASTNNNSGNPITTKEVKHKFEGNCQYCNNVGHKWIERRKRLRDEASGTYTKTQQRPQQTNNNGEQQQTDKPRYNSKLVCHICGKVGHSARDCRNRVPGASAYRNVPYEKQSTTENLEIRRDFIQSQNSRQPAYKVTQVTEQTAQTNIHNDCLDVEYNDEFESNSKHL